MTIPGGGPLAAGTRPAQSQLYSYVGPGAYLITVQAHTLWIEQAPGEDNNGDGQPDVTYKREGGQLILLKIPDV